MRKRFTTIARPGRPALRVHDGGRAPREQCPFEPDTFVLSDAVVAPVLAVSRTELEAITSAVVAARLELTRGRYAKCDEVLRDTGRLLGKILDERPRSPDPYPPCDVG